MLQELTQPITGYNSLAKAAEASDFPSDSEAVWEDRALQKNITDNFKANMFFEQRETVSCSRQCCMLHCTVLQCMLLWHLCVCVKLSVSMSSAREDISKGIHVLLILLPMQCLWLLWSPQTYLM